MENQSPRSPSIPERRPASGRKASRNAVQRGNLSPSHNDQADWDAGAGIINQMSAYSDWWNLPAGRPSNVGRHPIPGRPSIKRDRG